MRSSFYFKIKHWHKCNSCVHIQIAKPGHLQKLKWHSSAKYCWQKLFVSWCNTSVLELLTKTRLYEININFVVPQLEKVSHITITFFKSCSTFIRKCFLQKHVPILAKWLVELLWNLIQFCFVHTKNKFWVKRIFMVTCITANHISMWTTQVAILDSVTSVW
jgi:hypothetical protein